MFLTIAIPSHNKSYLLNQALNSIIDEGDFNEEIDILISDNSPSNDIKDLYDRKFSKQKKINLIDSSKFSCLDSNVNRSVEASKGEYVWIFGDDDLIVPGSIISIIRHLKKHKPSILVVNSQSFNQNGIIEKKRVPIKNNLVYGAEENDIFLANFGSYLTYLGAIVVKKNLWMENFDNAKIGSYFAHLDVLFKLKRNRIAHFLSKDCIKMRLGSQTWTGKSFEIWNIFFAEIIWGLKDYESQSKRKVISKYPFHSPKTLLASRVYGRLSFKIWKKTIIKSKKISTSFKLFILLICLIPRNFLKFPYKFIIWNIRKKHTLTFSPALALAQLDL